MKRSLCALACHHRARYFAEHVCGTWVNLQRSGPEDIWPIVMQDAQWLRLIKDDIHWLWRQLYNSRSFMRPRTGLQSLGVHYEVLSTLLEETCLQGSATRIPANGACTGCASTEWSHCSLPPGVWLLEPPC